ncbi:hypothetical protein F511_12664 [Dorcoceras hygrometricum]|uniref:Uncharacterized protein n=1 Tax=Dorcoceras hygrometricum TaxID=472368 RepID=A0A2Z7CJV5_9LAMI|nr:hypothetical protein F511_12664 [Dorcoceras hygrometricum]
MNTSRNCVTNYIHKFNVIVLGRDLFVKWVLIHSLNTQLTKCASESVSDCSTAVRSAVGFLSHNTSRNSWFTFIAIAGKRCSRLVVQTLVLKSALQLLSSSADCDDITADVIIADSRSCASSQLLIVMTSSLLLIASSRIYADVILADNNSSADNNEELNKMLNLILSNHLLDKFRFTTSSSSFLKAVHLSRIVRNTIKGIHLAVGSQHLRLRNHIFGLTHRIMVKRLATSPHDPLVIADSACKNQLVVGAHAGPSRGRRVAKWSSEPGRAVEIKGGASRCMAGASPSFDQFSLVSPRFEPRSIRLGPARPGGGSTGGAPASGGQSIDNDRENQRLVAAAHAWGGGVIGLVGRPPPLSKSRRRRRPPPSSPPPPLSDRTCSDQLFEEFPSMLISSGLLVQADEGTLLLVMDLIRRNLPPPTVKSQSPCDFGWSQAPVASKVTPREKPYEFFIVRFYCIERFPGDNFKLPLCCRETGSRSATVIQ